MLTLLLFKFTAFCFVGCFLLETFLCCYCMDRDKALSTLVSKALLHSVGKEGLLAPSPSPPHVISTVVFHTMIQIKKSILKYP